MQGFEINFGDDRVVDLTQQGFPHPIQSAVLPLLALTDTGDAFEDPQPLGTCFMIAPGLLVTATHVLSPVIQGTAWRENTQIAAVFASDEYDPVKGRSASWGGPLWIDRVDGNLEHDVALLSFPIPEVDGEQPTFSLLPLTIDLPSPGTRLLVFGYPNSSAGVGSSGAIRISQSITAAQGFVEEVLLGGRDRVMLKFPVLRADYPSEHGMSGGPVITPDGYVCGVVCSGMEVDKGTPIYGPRCSPSCSC